MARVNPLLNFQGPRQRRFLGWAIFASHCTRVAAHCTGRDGIIDDDVCY